MRIEPSWLGPRHWGQSAVEAADRHRVRVEERTRRDRRFMASTRCWWGSSVSGSRMALSKMTNVGLVLLQQTIVVVVSLGVAADINLGFHATPDQLLNRVNHDEVDDQNAGDG
jgi:hypothetical protein